ncbi:MAG: hypothetical protein KGJ01_02030 [Patescibacteria group bacterium]|nr:hypothetical protein [Patescibacteria group bacterium]
MVGIQFTSQNRKFMFLPGVTPLGRETEVDRVVRANRPRAGVLVIEPTNDCSLVGALTGLEACGFQLAQATVQERAHDRTPFLVIKFEFGRSAAPNASLARETFRRLCGDAVWKVSVYNNPFYENGLETEDRYVSVAASCRQPLTQAGVQVQYRLSVAAAGVEMMPA